jgi:hypothetical protein
VEAIHQAVGKIEWAWCEVLPGEISTADMALLKHLPNHLVEQDPLCYGRQALN